MLEWKVLAVNAGGQDLTQKPPSLDPNHLPDMSKAVRIVCYKPGTFHLCPSL